MKTIQTMTKGTILGRNNNDNRSTTKTGWIRKCRIALIFFLSSTIIAYSQNPASIHGESNATTGRAVFGLNTAASGSTAGVRGEVNSTSSGATGVFGLINNASGTGAGVKGQCNGTSGYGVWGQGGGGATGVLGQANSGSRYGVWAYNSGGGVALRTEGTGNLIEGWDLSPVNLKFKVDNSGNVTADGTYTSPAADFAELLPAAKGQYVEPGDVLAIGKDGRLVKSTKAYQRSVAGVCSTKPAFMGGAGPGTETIGKVPLAVVGIVPVKVTNENGMIRPGDMLVASDSPGFAMKARKKTPNGTVIGKSLGTMDKAEGMVSMLVILQ